MVSARWKPWLLDATHAGELEGDDVRRGRAEHPVCGDLVELSLRCVHGRIEAVRWRASGCPATMAVTALCANVLHGTAPADATAALAAAVAAHGGLAVHERHAEALVGRALRAAGC